MFKLPAPALGTQIQTQTQTVVDDEPDIKEGRVHNTNIISRGSWASGNVGIDASSWWNSIDVTQSTIDSNAATAGMIAPVPSVVTGYSS